MFRHDIKSLLAYSTISHLGLIVFLIGLSSPLSAVAAVFHLNLFMSLAALVPTLLLWRTPSAAHFGWFTALALVGALAHLSLTRSVQHAELTVLQPFEFTQLLWAALLGYAIFGETPAPRVLIGGAIIAGAAAWMVHREIGARPGKGGG